MKKQIYIKAKNIEKLERTIFREIAFINNANNNSVIPEKNKSNIENLEMIDLNIKVERKVLYESLAFL